MTGKNIYLIFVSSFTKRINDMVNLKKTFEAIKDDLAAANLIAKLTKNGITVTNQATGKEVYGCDSKGRTWNEIGWENEVEHLNHKIEYPTA